jgi:hypothetical protein
MLVATQPVFVVLVGWVCTADGREVVGFTSVAEVCWWSAVQVCPRTTPMRVMVGRAEWAEQVTTSVEVEVWVARAGMHQVAECTSKPAV